MSYRVGYSQTVVSGPQQRAIGVERAHHDQEFATLERAAKVMRAYKRRGFVAWVEDDSGRHVPVTGAKQAPKLSWFTDADEIERRRSR